MRGLLEGMREAGYAVDLEVVRAGVNESDDDGVLVSPDEARAFAHAQAQDARLDAVRKTAGDAALVEAFNAIPFDPPAQDLASRKWCCFLLGRLLQHLDGDPVEALIQIEGFWIEWHYPGPHGAIVGDRWQKADQTLKDVLAINSAWLEAERAAILATQG
ncbi:MAG: hypothetical protein K8H88_10025 [Sandaracinaceae bacterium]|nr:hypothetical protein [Sandaracinaceae bacterium]